MHIPRKAEVHLLNPRLAGRSDRSAELERLEHFQRRLEARRREAVVEDRRRLGRRDRGEGGRRRRWRLHFGQEQRTPFDYGSSTR